VLGLTHLDSDLPAGLPHVRYAAALLHLEGKEFDIN